MKYELGQRLKELRTAKRMTLSDVSKRVGVTISAVSSYELGERAPSYEVLLKLARLFRVSTDNLLGSSSRYSVDVTALTRAQRNTIRDVILNFELLNELQNECERESESGEEE